MALDGRDEVRVQLRLARRRVEQNHGDIEGSGGMPRLELRFRADVQVARGGVALQHLVRLKGVHLRDRHPAHVAESDESGEMGALPARECRAYTPHNEL